MFARSTRIPGRPERLDEGLEYLRTSVWPQLREMDGCVGMSVIADRTGGTCIATTAWASEEAMRATESSVEPLRAEGARAFGGSYAVEHWEIALLHRHHRSVEGASVRVTWLQVEPAELERGISVITTVTMPQVEELPGFCSASLFVDRDSGRCCLSASYGSARDMEQARETADSIRSETSRGIGAQILEVAEFELVMAHLHVPDLV